MEQFHVILNLRYPMKFGRRIQKTVLAIALCFFVDFFRGGMPFYSVIAATLCMQKDPKMGMQAGLRRAAGTFVGGAFGFLSILLFQYASIEFKSIPYIIIVSLMAAPIINANLLIGLPETAGFSCVVYYSVVVGHILDVAPLLFVANRILDTLIGIGVAILVNVIIPKKESADSAEL